MPSTKIPSVSVFRNWLACSLDPTDNPSKMVVMLQKSFCRVLDRRSATPDSLIRLPNVSAPIKGAASGSRKAQSSRSTSGKRIFSRLETGRSCVILILRSACVVSSFIMGGWIIGTSAIYEYAATAIAPNSCGARRDVKKMAVGPSAPPIMPMEAASFMPNANGCASPKWMYDKAIAPISVAKIPNCAAPPKSAIFGLAIKGPKSVIAPTDIKINSGKSPVWIPAS